MYTYICMSVIFCIYIHTNTHKNHRKETQYEVCGYNELFKALKLP